MACVTWLLLCLFTFILHLFKQFFNVARESLSVASCASLCLHSNTASSGNVPICVSTITEI